MDNEGYLTDHGAPHVKTVVDRASRLAATDTFPLTAYETYIILVAIHLHDVGNVYGRKGHEMRALTIMRDVLGNIAGMDDVEKRHIIAIAQAHGGHIAGDKDKISRLERDTLVLQQRIRPQFLAALLRLADELADDRHRASRFMLDAGLVPKPSEIYHKFAEALHTVEIDHAGRQVLLHFDFTDAVAIKTFGKGDCEVYLLDEIFDLTIKTHLERAYCMRFMYPLIPIDMISVKIEVTNGRDYDVMHSVGYRLEDRGYPAVPADGLRGICRAEDVPALTGEGLRSLLTTEVQR
ncbi:MAG: hypothetical protein IAG10_24750 [Planctomycetaceae bacterium]|nr:hypothetical protein [Planctomycetaceae bacterium]